MDSETEESLHQRRPMTCDELAEECAEYQRRMTEKMMKELPAQLEARMNVAGIVLDCDDDPDYLKYKAMMSTQNGVSSNLNGHKNSNGHSYFDELTNKCEDLERLLAVREREVDELHSKLNSNKVEHDLIIAELKDQLTFQSVEKQRSTTGLMESQEMLQKFQQQITSLREERDKLLENERSLKNDLMLQKLTIEDKDKMIKILENGSQDNLQIKQLENQMRMKEERHQAEMNNLNDQLELSLKKCKSFEMEVYELLKKVKYLDERNDELSTQKAQTVTQLMGQIEVLQEQVLRGSSQCADAKLQRLLEEAKVVERSLRAELTQKEVSEINLKTELKALRHQFDEMKKDADSPTESYGIQARMLELEQKLAQKSVPLVTQIVQTDDCAQDHNNAQYLKFHEEKFKETEARWKVEVEEKDAVIESLRAEIEEVKGMYLEHMIKRNATTCVDVSKLQEELATAKQRLLELGRTHSEYCQQELDKREKEINYLKEQNDEQCKKLLQLEGECKELTDQRMKLEENQQHAISRIEGQLQDYMNIVSTQSSEVIKLNDEIKRLKSVNTNEGTRQTTQTSKATSPIHSIVESKTVGTSPAGKSLTEGEVMRLLQTLALKHEQERLHYESRIEELQLQTLKKTSRQYLGYEANTQLKVDATTRTDSAAEPSSEVMFKLLQKIDELQTRNEQLTARTTQSQQAELELNRLQEDLQHQRYRAQKLKNEYSEAVSKYNKLRAKAKTYREHVAKQLLKLNEEWETERRHWKKEKEVLMKAQEVFEVERTKREKALLELKEDIRKLEAPRSYEAVDTVTRMYDAWIAAIKTENKDT